MDQPSKSRGTPDTDRTRADLPEQHPGTVSPPLQDQENQGEDAEVLPPPTDRREGVVSDPDAPR